MQELERTLREIRQGAESKAWKAVSDELTDEDLESAWEEFRFSDPEIDPNQEEVQLFASWLLYDWEPWEAAETGTRPRSARFSPASVALTENPDEFEESEAKFLIAALSTPPSFHEVMRSDKRHSLLLKDILLGSEMLVADNLASSLSVYEGAIVFARAVTFSKVGTLVGLGRVVLPPRFKSYLLEIRKMLRPHFRKLTPERLLDQESEVRDLYFDLSSSALSAARPEMVNTDGDPIAFHTLSYSLASGIEAIERLLPLVSEDERGSVREEAARARPGGEKRVTMSWTQPGNPVHGGMKNTVIADFKIVGQMLTVEVNSAERAKLVRQEIGKRLPDATLVSEELLAMDAALSKTGPETRRERADRLRQEELQARPEVQAAIAKMNADHYAAWPDMPLTALGGKTPRAAVRSKDGRERVEALLLQFEREGARRRDPGPPPYDFNRIREQLGLPVRER